MACLPCAWRIAWSSCLSSWSVHACIQCAVCCMAAGPTAPSHPSLHVREYKCSSAHEIHLHRKQGENATKTAKNREKEAKNVNWDSFLGNWVSDPLPVGGFLAAVAPLLLNTGLRGPCGSVEGGLAGRNAVRLGVSTFAALLVRALGDFVLHRIVGVFGGWVVAGGGGR